MAAIASMSQQIEENLQQVSAERFFQVVLSLSKYIYVTEITPAGSRQNLYLSPDIETLTGYPIAKLMADWSFWPSHIIHPDDRAAAAIQTARLTLSQNSEVEYRLIRPDGQILWVRDNAGAEAAGASKIVYGVITDITERKQREVALAKLLELSRTLVTTHDPTLLLDQIIKLAVSIAPVADRGSLQLLDEAGKMLYTVAISSPDEVLKRPLVFRPDVGIAGHALTKNQTINVPDVLADRRFIPGNLPLRFRSLLVAPLVVKGRLLGTLSLSSEQVAAFSVADETLVQLIADQVAASLENARLYDQIARFTQQLEDILKEPAETVQAAHAQLELSQLVGSRTVPADIFEALTNFLFYSNLSDLPTAVEIVSQLRPYHSPLQVALQHLGEVGAEVAVYQAATSRYQKLAALARSGDRLNHLSEFVAAHVTKQERTILEGIIYRWRRLVGQAGREIGASEEVGPVANPYVAGNPVAGDLFVGREDILRRLSELWNKKKGQCPSVVIYGHRRMGKTSILHNLSRVIDPQMVIVDFNMQRVGMVNNTGEMLYNLALAMYDVLSLEQQARLGEPDEAQFIDHNPYTTFDRFLKRFNRVRTGRRFIITVDEFELIEEMITQGQLEARLFAFWRSLIQTYPWYIMAFAGLHTLQEMTQDYWHPLFGSVKTIPVSFLSYEAAWRLITQPTPDFALDYETEAVEQIISLTRGQPYLIQLIGHGLVTRFNRQLFEEGTARPRRFRRVDVELIINSSEFYQEGDAYFAGIWRLAEQGAPGQQAILSVLAGHRATTEQLANLTGLSLEQTLAALRRLRRHDVVQRVDEIYISQSDHPDEILTDDMWDICVELMRRWIAQQSED